MNSINPPGAIAFQPGEALLLPWIEGTVRAGFPSPAADFAEKRHDLNELMITHPLATFMIKAQGHSMRELGIEDGDTLVCNRAFKGEHGDIVIAEVDGEFTVKQLYIHNGVAQLRSGNPTFPPIIFKDGQTMAICGVVTWTLKQLKKPHVRPRRRK